MTAPLERQFGQVPGLNQMTSTSSRRQLGHHAAVHPRPEHRRRRAGGAGGDQRRRHLPAARPAEPADLQQDQSGRRADPDAGADLRRRCRCRRCEDLADTRLAQKISQLPGVGLVSHQRRPEAGRAHPGQPDGAVRLRADPGGRAHRHRPPPTSIRPRAASTARARPTRSAPTTSCCRARTTGRWSSPTATARRCTLSDVADVIDDVENVAAGRLDERTSRRSS